MCDESDKLTLVIHIDNAIQNSKQQIYENEVAAIVKDTQKQDGQGKGVNLQSNLSGKGSSNRKVIYSDLLGEYFINSHQSF